MFKLLVSASIAVSFNWR